MTLAIAGNASGGYNLTKSLRFRSSASAYLNRTPSVAGNRKTWTFSTWVKRGQFVGGMYQGYVSTSSFTAFGWGGANASTLFMQDFTNGSYNLVWETSALFRDPAAWYHVVFAYDSTQASSSNALKLYVNGVQQTLNFTAHSGAYVQNRDSFINATNSQQIGTYSNSVFYDGYMAEINFVDGQQLTASSFGSTNPTTGVWQPAKYTGSYGTNGYYLPFTNTTSTTTLGYDFSGNGNNWTTNNISLTAGVNYDSMNDVPTLTSPTQANYPTFNAIWRGSYGGTLNLTDGNLKAATIQANSDNDISCTMALPGTGKWYWEVTITGGAAAPAGGTGYNLNITRTNLTGGVGWASKTGSPFSTTFTTNDVLGIAVDYSTLTWYGYKNGVLAGSQAIPADAVLPDFYYYGNDGTGASAAINFGQRPFSYTPPTGFVALNSYNLPDSTIKAGNKYMDATTFTSTGTTQTITNAGGFKPDFLWTKKRSAANNHLATDSVRGISKYLIPNLTNTEGTDANYVTSFNSNGFTLGTSNFPNGDSMVAWQWQAGQGTTSTNTNGSITSTVSVNASAGFSVVTYTGTGTTGTVGHGLGVAPSMMIVKARNQPDNWLVYHVGCPNPATNTLIFNSTGAVQTSSPNWNSLAPTSSVINVYNPGSGGYTNGNGYTYVAYCWAAVPGFSAFGSYTGNGSSDGPFIYTGFRPKFVMIKNTVDATSYWFINDSSRNTYNPTGLDLAPNDSVGESNESPVYDFLSNGFKLRCTYASFNQNGSRIIYMAWAENPFKNALAR